jgi:hypothetical protein
VNSINLKWDSWATSSLEMAIAWTFIRFRLLFIGLPLFLFEMFNVVLDFLIFIDVHYPLFYNSGSSYSFDSKGSNFFMES